MKNIEKARKVFPDLSDEEIISKKCPKDAGGTDYHPNVFISALIVSAQDEKGAEEFCHKCWDGEA